VLVGAGVAAAWWAWRKDAARGPVAEVAR
jgi:hypothetical protein